MKHKYFFYGSLLIELIIFPLKFIVHWCDVLLKNDIKKNTVRLPVSTKRVKVVVHEWGGFPLVRMKTIKKIVPFQCGLIGQLQRFSNRSDVDLTVTMSDAWRCENLLFLKKNTSILEVSNAGMDFSGYSTYYEKIKNSPNQYVIFTNSSVNSIQEEFLDGYIEFMEQNQDVGMLGISYCTKMKQTLMRVNFTPHLQSFFLLTTIDVINQMVALNNGKFPGIGIKHKSWLIREGEIRVSNLIQQLGYRLAVVNPIDGQPYKFTSYRNWSIPFDDIRLILKKPNRITPIKK